VVASTALVFAALPIAVLGGLVRLTSPGPAFFRQTRVGRDGREFQIWKLRTMFVGADTAPVDGNDADGILFKLRRDPRVTPLGHFLRRWSLDELPQLWNVVRGSMSLVGPRPPLPREVAQYGDDVRRRLLVTPGLTGLWQVSGRSDLAWDEAVRLDLQYVENWSLSLDLVVLLRTMTAVLRRRGAY
jgi:lipopolysaccharide/colanic/teichoic acid biosynthesis glycosyltransferase